MGVHVPIVGLLAFCCLKSCRSCTQPIRALSNVDLSEVPPMLFQIGTKFLLQTDASTIMGSAFVERVTCM